MRFSGRPREERAGPGSRPFSWRGGSGRISPGSGQRWESSSPSPPRTARSARRRSGRFASPGGRGTRFGWGGGRGGGSGEEESGAVCVAGGTVDPFRLADDLMFRNGKECIEKFRRFAAGAESGDYHALVGAIAWSVRRRLAAAAHRG